MIGTTVGELIQRVQRDVGLGSRSVTYTLAAQHVSGTDTIQLTEPIQHFGPGSVVSMGVSLYYVLTTDSVTNTITVIPGYLGSTDETHDPPMEITVDDRYPGAAVLDWAQQEVQSWKDQLWQVDEVTVDVTRDTTVYDFAETGIYFVLEARRQPAGAASWSGFSWHQDRWPRVSAKILGHMPVADFASEQALQFVNGTPYSGQVRLALAKRFDLSAWTWDTDLVADVGIEEDWLEIVELGTIMRGLSKSVSSRADWRKAGHARNAEEVTLIDVVRAADMARAQRQEKFAAAAVELRGRWPYAEN